MARQRETVVKIDDPEQEQPPETPRLAVDVQDEEELEDIEGVVSQIADEAATVVIKRWNPTPDDPSRPWDYVTTVPAREFNLETIKREYGGGRYKAVTFDRNRRFVKGGTRHFNIDKTFRATPKAGPAVETVPAPSGEIAALRNELSQLKSLIQANNSTKETLDMALKIAAVFRGGGGGGGGMSPDALFGTATKIIEFSKSLAGDGERVVVEEDPVAIAVKELAKPIAEILTGEVQRRMAGRAPNPPRLPTQPADTPAAPPEAPVANAPPWLASLRPYLPQLLMLAKENADPALYADVVYDLMERKLPAAKLAEVEQAAADPGFEAAVVDALPPSCAPFKAWFTALVGNLKKTLVAPPSPSEDDEEEGGG